MARKASQKLITASDKLALRFSSEKSEFGDTEYASSDDNYDLIIEELDYVNQQLAKIDNTQPHKPAPKTTKTIKRKPVTNRTQSEWKNANELMAYFPTLLRNEITDKLCKLQPIMPDKIMKRGKLMALHISALTEFARRAGLTITKTPRTKKTHQPQKPTPQKTSRFRKGATKLHKSKKQILDEENMVYVIKAKTK